MKQQVVAIHGGTSFDSYDDYIKSLRTRDLTREKLRQCNDWRNTLAQELGEEFEVFVPKMPNPSNARYEEWCIWFDRCAAYFKDNLILIGHSLGGIFVAKYLSEHKLPVTLKATILVSAPYNDTITFESLRDYRLPSSLALLEQQAGSIYLVHSRDDNVVSFEETGKYLKVLPGAKLIAMDGRQHFNQEKFPELVDLLRAL